MKKKAPTKTQIKNDCLELWSLIVRTRDRKCRICGSDQNLSAHHIRSRVHHATMLDIENGLCLCWRKCHFLQKANPERFMDKIIDIIGQPEYDRLKARSASVFKYTTKDLLMMRDHLRRLLVQHENDYGELRDFG